MSLDFRKIQFISIKSNLDKNFLGSFSFKNLEKINSAKLNRLENGNFIISFIQANTQKKVNDSRELFEENSYNENRFEQVHHYQMTNKYQIASQAYNSPNMPKMTSSLYSLREEAFKEDYKFIIRNLSSLKLRLKINY
ncbi:unnamed protein product [Brachionus calyciflorus]|uniref:Uncharacterized protein n=1 Tax=Brachionus calyciflorus TaxID=104777 RepID=A0A814N460_9BILA|nr:unnamed protein product [Brachionus calyciflorus]